MKLPPSAISSREDIERIFADASSRLEDALTLAREVAVAGMPSDSAGPAPAAHGAKCFECGAPAAHDHHVVPRSLGGTKTVPLCLRCHGNAHGRGRSFRNTPELTKAALGVKRARGERVGCVPWGWRVADDGVQLLPHPGERATTARAKDLRAHRLASRVTPLALWEAMAAGDNLDAIRREIPEEFWPDFDAIRAELAAQHKRLVAAVDAEVARWQSASDKDVGLALSTVPADVRPFLFAARRGGDGWALDPKLRAALHKPLRPTANMLDGYAPTDRIARVQDAA